MTNISLLEVDDSILIAIVNPFYCKHPCEVPAVENGGIKAGWRMKATISVDRRISDRAEGARFMHTLAKYLEEPLRLLV
jgi:hypothetical protein